MSPCRILWFTVAACLAGCGSIEHLAPDAGEIIPGIIEYKPPDGYVPNPYAPKAPQWWLPPDGVLPQIEFSLDSGEILFGERAVEFSRSPSWERLRELGRHPRWPINALDPQLSEATVDGKAVLILDFMTHPYAQMPPEYWSRIWIPVAPNLFLQGFVSSDDRRQRDGLRQSFQRIKIHRYWNLPAR